MIRNIILIISIVILFLITYDIFKYICTKPKHNSKNEYDI